jgi:biotin carboxylase
MSDGPLLVLGASVHQLDVIERARERGVEVVVADNVPGNPGHRLADRSHVVDTTDVEAIAALARAEGVAGVVAPCTDVAVPTAAVVAARLGLPGIDPATAAVVTSKPAFRRWQREAGLPAPEALALDGEAVLPDAGPWLVKPAFSSGSKGVRMVADTAGLTAAAEAARAFGPEVLAERVVEGHHVTVEGVVRDGDLGWAVVLDRQTAAPPWTATTGHRLPTVLGEAEAAAAIDAVRATVRALGLGDGPLDADLVLAGEPVVLELSPRLGGNSITALLALATGIDLAALAIDVALGRPMGALPPPEPRPSAVALLGAGGEGRLAYDRDQADALRAEPWVAGLDIAEEGTLVRAFTDGRAVVGRVFVTAEDRSGVDARVDEALARLAVRAT